MSKFLSPGQGAAPVPDARRWPKGRLPPALTVSVAVHVGALGVCVFALRAWPLALAVIAVNHAVVTAAGLWPRSSLLGANWTHLPDTARNAKAIALTIDDGPDPEVTPKVLDILDAHAVHATFFLIGERAQRYPALTREIVARGHCVENHSQRHVHTFSVSGLRAIAREVRTAQHTLHALTGELPAFFRAPAGLRNVFLEAVLRRQDLRLASWTRRGFDTREGDASVVSARLLKNLAPRDILLLHDAHAAHDSNGEPVLLAVLPRVIETAREQGLHFVTLREAR